MAGARGPGGLCGNGSDPFTKWLKAFWNIGIVKFSGDEGPTGAIRWIVQAQRMVFILKSLLIEHAHRELLSY